MTTTGRPLRTQIRSGGDAHSRERYAGCVQLEAALLVKEAGLELRLVHHRDV
jgi:hypothetical protein